MYNGETFFTNSLKSISPIGDQRVSSVHSSHRPEHSSAAFFETIVSGSIEVCVNTNGRTKGIRNVKKTGKKTDSTMEHDNSDKNESNSSRCMIAPFTYVNTLPLNTRMFVESTSRGRSGHFMQILKQKLRMYIKEKQTKSCFGYVCRHFRYFGENHDGEH